MTDIHNQTKIPNLLDSDNPKIDVPLLLPKKNLNKNLNKILVNSKEKTNNLFDNTKEKILKLFDKYNPLNNKGIERIKNWYNYLKDNVFDIFNKIQGKTSTTIPLKFELDKEALNVTKRYEIDLKKSELSLYDPLTLLEKIKTLVIEKFKKYPSTKQQITLVCLMKKTNPATGE